MSEPIGAAEERISLCHLWALGGWNFRWNSFRKGKRLTHGWTKCRPLLPMATIQSPRSHRLLKIVPSVRTLQCRSFERATSWCNPDARLERSLAAVTRRSDSRVGHRGAAIAVEVIVNDKGQRHGACLGNHRRLPRRPCAPASALRTHRSRACACAAGVRMAGTTKESRTRSCLAPKRLDVVGQRIWNVLPRPFRSSTLLVLRRSYGFTVGCRASRFPSSPRRDRVFAPGYCQGLVRFRPNLPS